MSKERFQSFHDEQLRSLLDEALANACRVWHLRPAPPQRMERIKLTESLDRLWNELKEDAKELFPMAFKAWRENE